MIVLMTIVALYLVLAVVAYIGAMMTVQDDICRWLRAKLR